MAEAGGQGVTGERVALPVQSVPGGATAGSSAAMPGTRSGVPGPEIRHGPGIR